MSNRKYIRLAKPSIKYKELSGLEEIIESGILTKGKYVLEFERKIAEYTGASYAIATTSATTALHLSLCALEIGCGDEVIIPDFTFPATLNIVLQQRAIPVLVDIEKETYNINPQKIKDRITKKTKAIIPVHLFGYPSNMDPILKIAKANGLYVIEDAACALGAKYKEKYCGNIGNIGCFSFHPRKIITTGEGGAAVVNNRSIMKKMKMLHNHGGLYNKKLDRQVFKLAGYNYRMSEMQALMGIAQLRKLDRILSRRKKLAQVYVKKLTKNSYVTIPQSLRDNSHTFQSFVVLLDSKVNRNKVIKDLKNRGIEATLGTYSLHAQLYMKKYFELRNGEFPNSYFAYRHSITLPLYNDMTYEDQDYVVNALTESINKQN